MTVRSDKFFTDWVAGTGAKDQWSYDFTILSSDVIRVQVRVGLDGDITEYTTNYTWYPTNDDEGYVKYPSVGAKVPNGSWVRLVRQMDLLQETEIGNEGPYHPEIHERAFDKLTMITQQISDAVSRAPKVPLGDTTQMDELTDRLIAVSDNLDHIVGVDDNKANIDIVAGDTTNIDTVAGSIASVNTTAGSIASVNTVAGSIASVNTVAGSIGAVEIVATNVVEIIDSGGQAIAAKNDAIAAKDKAEEWATKAEDSPVETGPNRYSALHWATKAANLVLSGYAGAIHAATGKTTPTGADELAIADSAASWGLKKLTLTNLAAWLAGLAQTLTNKTLTSPTIDNATFTGIDPWAFQPIGVPIPVQKNITGVSAPPTNQAYRYILLTAGETGSGKYNNGVLGSESVTGSAPLVQATATVTLSGSPINGQSVRLINTERRVLRAGSAGTVENDQMQQITGEIRSGMHAAAAIGMLNTPAGAISSWGSINNAYPSPVAVSTIADGISFDSAKSPNARTGTETRAKNIGVEYYMRIK